MSRLRTLAALTIGSALLITPQVLPASASSSHSDAAVSVQRAGQALIQGVVTDQSGRYLDDVKVQATKGDGTAAASALTYASDRPGGPQHGYFYLEVTKGSYTLTLSRAGYKTVTYGPHDITKRGQKISLGEIVIKKAQAETTTKATLGAKSITTKQNGSVVVTVSTKATPKPTGSVEVREGRKVVGKAQLKSTAKGQVTVSLDKLATGKHQLTAYFLGSSSLKASSSSTVTLTVTKARR